VIVYLHGFNSTPSSHKATYLKRYLEDRGLGGHYACPALPHLPDEAVAAAEAAMGEHPVAQVTFVGSSLGGFYATAVAERRGCRAVLLNPAVDPARDLAAAVGSTTAWHSDERFEFRAEYVDELRAIAPPPTLTRPERYLAVIATGDEVLSWHEMRTRYAEAKLLIVAGSDHALSEFDVQMPVVLAFLGLGAAQTQ
jgi:predicted esterase YcpF (UPF0227 family)